MGFSVFVEMINMRVRAQGGNPCTFEERYSKNTATAAADYKLTGGHESRP